MKFEVVVLPLATEKQLHAYGIIILKSLTETEVIYNLAVRLLSKPLWQKFTNNFYS